MSSILPCTCFPCFSPRAPLTVLSIAPPSLWCQTPVHRAWWDPGLHGIRATVALRGWTLCLFVSPNPNKRSYVTPVRQRVPPPWCSLCCWWRWLLSDGPTGEENRPFVVFRLLVVAAWLQCSAEILPPSRSLDNACGSRLAASFRLLLYITVYGYTFWLLIFFFYFVSCSFLFLSTF